MSRESLLGIVKKNLSKMCFDSLSLVAESHPLLKGGYTGHEKMCSGDLDISPVKKFQERKLDFCNKFRETD